MIKIHDQKVDSSNYFGDYVRNFFIIAAALTKCLMCQLDQAFLPRAIIILKSLTLAG